MIIRIELSNVRFYETKAAGKNDGAYFSSKSSEI